MTDPASGQAALPDGWAVADDPVEVHDLLCASDAHQAAATGSPAPARRLATTRQRVEAGAVHLLRVGGRAVGMFTLTAEAPYDASTVPFPAARQPHYLSRLSVHPDELAAGSLIGVRCLRRAVQVAAASGADSLRSEANPDLAPTWSLLTGLGFVPCGPTHSDPSGRSWAYLHKPLPGPTG
ncbi:hypothetical protein [Micromonospora sp. RTGN7]|uniref:hypothetical protein n=1 Tax=Micromonospora sp. RTGN7 TaxID=3016526 RepID=UPI0029FECD80|nr:hypothetical protein [Micromonospora sp. RTGN7]